MNKKLFKQKKIFKISRNIFLNDRYNDKKKPDKYALLIKFNKKRILINRNKLFVYIKKIWRSFFN